MNWFIFRAFVIDFLTRLLFEDLWLLLIAEAVGFGIVLAVHRRRFSSTTRRAIWIALMTCITLPLIQWFVVTDREALQQLVQDMVSAADAGDMIALGTTMDEDGVRLDDGAQAVDCDRSTFLAAAAVSLQRYPVDNASAGGFQIQVVANEATVSFHVTCDLRVGSNAEYRMPSFWTIRCVRRPDGWKLRQIRSARLGLERLGQQRDIMPEMKDFRSIAVQHAPD